MTEKIEFEQADGKQNDLWQAYRNVRIRCYHSRFWRAPCAILTAYHPRSVAQEPKANLAAQRTLIASLMQQSLPFCPVLVGNPGFSYSEPSLAVLCTRAKAHQLCGQFAQNAYYYCEQGIVTLHWVLMKEGEDAQVGLLSELLDED